MPTTPETDILKAFEARMGTLSTTPATRVAWPEVPFAPGPEEPHLRVFILPSPTGQITLGDTGFNRHVGTFQVSVAWPEDEGITAARRIADAVAAHFQRGTHFTYGAVTVRIIAPPSVAPHIKDQPFTLVPVSVRYQADALNPA